MTTLTKNDPCTICGRFDNRGVSVDAVIIRDNTILLIKRGVEPYKGYWGTPGGYVSWDESTEETVAREVKEETGLDVTSTKLVCVRSDPSRHPKQVINLVYLVEVADGQSKQGDDALEVKLFPLDALPEQLAFDHAQNIQDAIKFRNRT